MTEADILELYDERKSICIVDGVASDIATRLAYSQVRQRFPGVPMPERIKREVKNVFNNEQKQ